MSDEDVGGMEDDFGHENNFEDDYIMVPCISLIFEIFMMIRMMRM